MAASFICPGECATLLHKKENADYTCPQCGKNYPGFEDRPCFTEERPEEIKNFQNRSRFNRWLNRYEALYVRSVLSPGFFLHRRIDGFLKRSADRTGGTVHEVGSGDRKRERFFKGRYVAVDYPTTQGSLPKASLPDVWADAHRLPFERESIDAVLNLFVVEHVKDPRGVIRECARVLKRGGHLILGGPGDLCMTHGDPYHYYNLTRYAYYEIFKETGLEIREELVPQKAFNTVLQVVHDKVTRNDWYNSNLLTKLLQLIVIVLLVLPTMLLTLLARLLDRCVPDDKRGYSVICFLLEKKR